MIPSGVGDKVGSGVATRGVGLGAIWVTVGDKIVVMTAVLGRMKEYVDVDMPRPRYEESIKLLPRYSEMREHIWDLLRDEARRTLRDKAHETGG